MPRVPEGKKVFNTSLHKDVIEELEYIVSVLGITRTKFVELAVKDMINTARESPEWAKREKQYKEKVKRKAILRAEIFGS